MLNLIIKQQNRKIKMNRAITHYLSDQIKQGHKRIYHNLFVNVLSIDR